MTNVLLITSDQHNPFFSGYAGDRLVRTPNLDGLAADGAVFTAAYTSNPICMPARASLATGRYGSDINSYDNGSPYHQSKAETFGHRLREQGRAAATFGKLHFAPDVDSGFDMRLPLQAKQGYGAAITGWARGDASAGDVMVQHALDAAPGPSEYELYDRHTTVSACRWLTGAAPAEAPWFAHVSYAYPHYPFRAPAELLPADDIDIQLPPAWGRTDWPHNPELDAHRRLMGYEDRPLTEDEIRRLRWIYAGMVNFVDVQVGEVLEALDQSGQGENTVVIYTSDHGDMLGSHGFLMKSLMYDASARVPLLVRGPGVDPGTVSATAASLIDVFPTVLAATETRPTESDAELPGTSLVQLAGSPTDADRAVFSEYHGPSSSAASFMVRQGRWKYVRHMLDDAPAQLFDMEADPDELNDLLKNPAADESSTGTHQVGELVDGLDQALRTTIDPEATDRRIRNEQQELLAKAGGPKSRAAARDLPRTEMGTIAVGWSVPPPEIMAAVRNRQTAGGAKGPAAGES